MTLWLLKYAYHETSNENRQTISVCLSRGGSKIMKKNIVVHAAMQWHQSI